MAATEGIADEEQGLASGLLFTSLQFGGAVALAIATAAMEGATAGSGAGVGSTTAVLDGMNAALVVSVIASLIGLAIMASGIVSPARARAARFRTAWQQSDLVGQEDHR